MGRVLATLGHFHAETDRLSAVFPCSHCAAINCPSYCLLGGQVTNGQGLEWSRYMTRMAVYFPTVYFIGTLIHSLLVTHTIGIFGMLTPCE